MERAVIIPHSPLSPINHDPSPENSQASLYATMPLTETSEHSQLSSHQSDASFLLQRPEQVQIEQNQLGSEAAAPKIHQCDQCEETFRQLPVLTRHEELFHNPSNGPAPLGITRSLASDTPQQSGPLLFLNHYDRWMGIINRTTNENTPTATLTLKKIRELAEETLKSAVASGCLPHPHHGLKTTLSSNHTLQHFKDQPAEELIRTLGNTERHLKALDHHLESLVGNGDPEDGLLAEWTNYQSRPGHPGFLPDPGDILDDLDFIDSCLVMVKDRTLAITGSMPSSPSTPGEGPVAEELYLSSSPSSPGCPPPTAPVEVVSMELGQTTPHHGPQSAAHLHGHHLEPPLPCQGHQLTPPPTRTWYPAHPLTCKSWSLHRRPKGAISVDFVKKYSPTKIV